MKIIICKKAVERLTRSPIMSLLLSITLSITLCSSFAFAQETVPTKQTNSQKPDVSGWQNARWGMSQSDLQNAFANTGELQTTKLVCGDPYFASNVCGFKNFQLAGERFSVMMSGDKKTGDLNQILIALDEVESSKARLTLFDQMEALLGEKYGVASYKKDQNLLDLVVRTRQWSFLSTTIELHYSYVGRIKASLLLRAVLKIHHKTEQIYSNAEAGDDKMEELKKIDL